MEKKAMIGAVMAIIAVILIGITMFTPWYNVHFTASGSYSGVTYDVKEDVDAYFTYVNLHMTATAAGQTQTRSLASDYDKDSEPGKVFGTTMLLAILTLIFAILGVIAGLLVAFGTLKPTIGALLILPVIILAFITPLYLMTALPPAIGKQVGVLTGSEGEFMISPPEKMTTQFFGSDHIEYNTGYLTIPLNISWGGALAWFLSFIAGIISIIAMIFVFLSKPEERMPLQYMYPEEYPPQQEMHQYPQYQQPPSQYPPQQPQYPPQQPEEPSEF